MKLGRRALLIYAARGGLLLGLGAPVGSARAQAERGVTTSFANLAIMYKYGKGTPRNHRLALKWMTQAATTGNNSGAHTSLGHWYLRGQGSYS